MGKDTRSCYRARDKINSLINPICVSFTSSLLDFDIKLSANKPHLLKSLLSAKFGKLNKGKTCSQHGLTY